ncbi:MAG: BTAD domain-containing putative transcriptional regulator [Gemmatimonadales bacterium]
MIRLHTLGALDLRDHEGKELGAVLRQPKRLGLLAYLTLASPRRFHRRDSLLALFWPDLDEEHARAALRRALYFLRVELGADVVTGRGEEEVGVSEQLLWCDAAELERGAAKGEFEDAVGLYRGILLEGLHVAGASPDFQEWLDRERGAVRERATAAARSLVTRAETEGRLADATAWARRVVDLEPEDEPALRRLLGLYDLTGDRPAALRAYEEHSRRMQQQLDLEPSAETRALVERIRSRAEATTSRPSPPASPTTIVVLPFSVRGDPRLSYLREGMVDLLATRLDGAGPIRTVDARAVLRSSLSEGRAVAAYFGAGRYLAGTIVEAGGRLRASATLYGVDDTVIASVDATAENEAAIFALVDEIALELLAAEGVSRGTRLTHLAALTTGSLDALKAYLRGEEKLRGGRYFDAMDAFQQAVEADPSFALAHYRLAAAAAGCALPDLAREVSDRGFEHRERLSTHDQLVFTAQRAWLHGRVADAESLYNTITGSYPDDVEAWFHLGDLLFHSNPLRGRSAAEAREPFERVIRLDPRHLAAMVHLVRISAIEGRRDEMLRLIDRILQVSPDGDQALAMRALRAYANRDAAAMTLVAGELQHARAITVAIAFSDVALYSGNLEGAERLARGFIQAARSPEMRALCHILVACLTVAGGRMEEARAELALAEALDPTWGLEMQALFASLSFLPAPEGEIERIRDALERWDVRSPPPSNFLIFAMHNDLHPGIRAWLLGLLEVRLGDVERAGGWAEELALLEQVGGGLLRNMLAELRATIARADGRPGEALALLESSRPELWFQLTIASPFFSLASSRFLRAELLRELGRTREAAGWLGSIAQRSPYELIYARAAGERLAANSQWPIASTNFRP